MPRFDGVSLIGQTTESDAGYYSGAGTATPRQDPRADAPAKEAAKEATRDTGEAAREPARESTTTERGRNLDLVTVEANELLAKETAKKAKDANIAVAGRLLGKNLVKKEEGAKEEGGEGETKEKREGKAADSPKPGKKKGVEKEGSGKETETKPAKKKAAAKAEEVNLYATDDDATPAKPINEPRIAKREDIIAATKTAVTEAIKAVRDDGSAKGQKRQPVDPMAKYGTEMQEFADHCEVAAHMHPELYGGRDIRSEVSDYLAKRLEYEKDWKTDNPGEVFDWKDHTAWEEENDLGFDERHVDEGKRVLDEKLIEERISREVEQRLEKEMSPYKKRMRQEEAQRKHAPVIHKSYATVAAEVLGALRPDLREDEEAFAAIIADPAAFRKKVEEDPIDDEVTQRVFGETSRLLELAGAAEFEMVDLSRRDLNELNGRLLEMQQEIAKIPESKRPRMPDGRVFTIRKPVDGWQAPEGTYTVYDWEVLSHLVPIRARHRAAEEKKKYETKYAEIAKKRGFAPKQSANADKSEEESGDGGGRRPAGPSVSAAAAQAKPGKETGNGMHLGLPLGLLQKVGYRG